MKSGYLNYPWAILYGLYFYAIFQLMYLTRFGSFNLRFSLIDLGIYLVGVGSVLICMYFAQKATKLWPLTLAFVLAIPFSYVGALMGGLFGFIGMLVAGLIPFAVFLPIAYLFVKPSAPSTSAPSAVPGTPPSSPTGTGM